MKKRILASATLIGLSAQAAPLTEDAFNQATLGKTITFTTPDGQYYGAEQYFQGRRVLWMYSDGTCNYGIWWPEGDTICFLYDEALTHQCWITEQRDGRIFAHVAGAPPESAIGSSEISQTPLPCPGPDVGV